MKKHFSRIVVILYVSLLNFSIFRLYADDIPIDDDPSFPFQGDAGQPPQTPIDGWVPFMLLIAIGLVFYYTHKKKEVKS